MGLSLYRIRSCPSGRTEQLKVLVSRKTAEAFGESLWHTLKEISKGKYLCQATVNLDAAFSKYQNPRSFAAWHDIENDLFFSFSEAYLLLAKSILSQPIGDGGAGPQQCRLPELPLWHR